MRYITISLSCFLFFSGGEAFSQDKSLNPYKYYFSNQLKSWTRSFNNFQLSHFKKYDSTNFENQEYMSIGSLKSFYKLYKPALTFSPDSNEFIDIYSYWLNLEKKGKKIVTNAEVDQAVSICNLKKKIWTRILFCGVSTSIEEAIWVTNTTFILTGTVMDEKNEFHPTIYLGDMKKRRFFIYKDSLSVPDKNGYTSPNFKKLNIKDE